MEEREPHINSTGGKKKTGSGKDPAVQKDRGCCCPIAALLVLPSQKKASAGASIPLQDKEEVSVLNPPWTDPISCGAFNTAEGAGVMLGQETDVRLGAELIYNGRAYACFCFLG